MRAGSRRPVRAGAREIGIRIMGRGAAPCMNGMFCFRELPVGRRSGSRDADGRPALECSLSAVRDAVMDPTEDGGMRTLGP
ncbi:hypothetical protein W824_02080 [Clavibacter cf. michiganensis LMG 26808]|uniref:Uncharacterized protein n=1 Tax=Clavibacter michiganensis TaxID=28447 RepID=A0A399NNQ5_9MICO|nr:hypothetical protein W824_02080 [Clavibacter cf. michiganensis LMG 26808]RII95795.1 hypothetical protein DZF96_13755 [Clavibacter michiganensis]